MRAAALAAIVLASSGCVFVGPTALHNGRTAYNSVINATEDQQILSMIVRRRYDETFGMLAVANVTAGLRVGAMAGANVGIGPNSAYEGNLVPFSASATYEENPTIMYVPLRGEQFIQRMLAPVSAEQALLLSRMSTDEVEVLRMLVRRANGLVNPLFASPSAAGGDAFDRFVALYARLRDEGRLDLVRSGDDYVLLLHDFAGDGSHEVDELLRTLGIDATRARRGPRALPLRFFVGEPRADSIDLETPSALEIIEAAGAGIAVPEPHLADGLARAVPPAASATLIDIHSSRDRPSHASVAVRHRDWWFFVDARDARSKQAFMVLRTLIGMRLDEGGGGTAAPLLTIPVAR